MRIKSERRACETYWASHKYLVLSYSSQIYLAIREYLKSEEPALEQVRALVQEAVSLPEHRGQVITAYQHVWGYFKKKASQAEKEQFMMLLERYQYGRIEQEKLAQAIRDLLVIYPNRYLQGSSLLFGGVL